MFGKKERKVNKEDRVKRGPKKKGRKEEKRMTDRMLQGGKQWK